MIYENEQALYDAITGAEQTLTELGVTATYADIFPSLKQVYSAIKKLGFEVDRSLEARLLSACTALTIGIKSASNGITHSANRIGAIKRLLQNMHRITKIIIDESKEVE